MLNKYVSRNGRDSPFKWTNLQLEFENIVHHKLNSENVLKNKYDAMRKDYNLWKSLKNGDTWNPTTRALNCSDDLWEKLIEVTHLIFIFNVKLLLTLIF